MTLWVLCLSHAHSLLVAALWRSRLQRWRRGTLTLHSTWCAAVTADYVSRVTAVNDMAAASISWRRGCFAFFFVCLVRRRGARYRSRYEQLRAIQISRRSMRNSCDLYRRPLQYIYGIFQVVSSSKFWNRSKFFYIYKEMIRGAGPGFGSNCRRYFFITNNETCVSGFLWMGLSFRDSSYFMSKINNFR